MFSYLSYANLEAMGAKINKQNASLFNRGFTIVELLIVIVVIGILAAITTAAYSGIRAKGYDATVKSDLAALAKKVELYRIDEPAGKYPYGNTAFEAIDIAISTYAYDTQDSISYNLLNCTHPSTPGINYALLAISKSGRKFYTSSVSNGVQEYTGGDAWGDISMCTSVLPGSTGNGAGYAKTGGWRTWVN